MPFLKSLCSKFYAALGLVALCALPATFARSPLPPPPEWRAPVVQLSVGAMQPVRLRRVDIKTEIFAGRQLAHVFSQSALHSSGGC